MRIAKCELLNAKFKCKILNAECEMPNGKWDLLLSQQQLHSYWHGKHEIKLSQIIVIMWLLMRNAKCQKLNADIQNAVLTAEFEMRINEPHEITRDMYFLAWSCVVQ